MTKRNMEILLDVAESGSMSKTARRLYISPSSVSQVISGLEHRYGVALFARSGQRLTLTPTGLTLCSYARQILNLYREMEGCLVTDSRQTFRLGSSFSLASTFISPAIFAFQQEPENSDITINLTVNRHDKLIEQLLNYDLDLVAMLVPTPENPYLTVVPLFDDPVCLCCGKDHPFALRTSVALADLADQNITLLPHGSSAREHLEHVLRKKGIVLKKVLNSNNQASIKDMVLHNQTISLMSHILVREEMQQGAIVAIELEDFSYNRTFCLAYRKDSQPSPELDRFIQICLSKQSRFFP